MAIEIRSTKGKGWILAGSALMLLGCMNCVGGSADGGTTMFVLGACCFGIGKAIRWWVRPDR